MQKEDGTAIISIHLNPEQTSSQEFQLMSPNRAITSGAVWERTISTWHTSRSIQHLDEISDQFMASLIVLNFQEVDLSVIILPLCTETATVKVFQKGGNLYATVDQFGLPKGSEDYARIAIGPTHELHSLIRKCMKTSLSPLSTVSHQTPLLGSSGLGFCSCEALGAGRTRPTLANLTATLDKFESRAPGSITTLLIDDGWQHVSSNGSRRLVGLDMDPSLIEQKEQQLAKEKGDSLLGNHIRSLRSRFPLIKEFGVWMTLAGYWSGLEPASFSELYGPLVEARLHYPPWTHNVDQTWWLPAVDKLESFYNDYFSLLHQAGISFIKVDDQSDWDWIQSLASSHSITPSAYYDLT